MNSSIEHSFVEKANAYWNQDRIKKVTSGKKYILTPLNASLLLRKLGVLNSDASMSADNLKKYIQINHMFNLLEPFFEDLKKQHKIVRVLDAGCGKSYLTFLLAWKFLNDYKHPADILGVDVNEKIINDCTNNTKELDYESILSFEKNSLATFKWNKESRPHAVVALHACDTATDMAIAFGIQQKSDFIAIAPCCQAELAKKWKDDFSSHTGTPHPLNPIFSNPLLRREIAAQFTDALRLCLIRAHGYEVTVHEFVSSVHTPKNKLFTCVKRGNYLTSAQKEYDELKNYLGGKSIYLEDLLSNNQAKETPDSLD